MASLNSLATRNAISMYIWYVYNPPINMYGNYWKLHWRLQEITRDYYFVYQSASSYPPLYTFPLQPHCAATSMHSHSAAHHLRVKGLCNDTVTKFLHSTKLLTTGKYPARWSVILLDKLISGFDQQPHSSGCCEELVHSQPLDHFPVATWWTGNIES